MDMPASVYPPVRNAHLSLRVRSMLRRVSKNAQQPPPSPSPVPTQPSSSSSQLSSTSDTSVSPAPSQPLVQFSSASDTKRPSLSVITDFKPKAPEPNPYSPDAFSQFESLFVQKTLKKDSEPKLELLLPVHGPVGQGEEEESRRDNMSESVTEVRAKEDGVVTQHQQALKSADDVLDQDIKDAFAQLKLPPQTQTQTQVPETRTTTTTGKHTPTQTPTYDKRPQERLKPKGPTNVDAANVNWRVPSGLTEKKLREPLPAVPWDGRIRWAATFDDLDDSFDEVRFRPTRITKDTHRTVALLGLPPNTSVLDLTNVICGGKLISLNLSPYNPGQHLAGPNSTCMGIAVFVLGIDALAFVEYAQQHTIRIRDTPIQAILYKDAPTYPLSNEEDVNIFENGHTRSLKIRGPPDADRLIVIQELVRTGIPKIYADAAAVVAGPEPDRDCLVHLNSMHAMKVATDVLMKYSKRNKCWVSNADDPCDRPICC